MYGDAKVIKDFLSSDLLNTAPVYFDLSDYLLIICTSSFSVHYSLDVAYFMYLRARAQ